MRKTLAIALGCALGAMAAPAAAEVINLGTGGPLRHAVQLEAGTWQITPLGIEAGVGSLYSGYSVWSDQAGCNAEGLNCTRGWRWVYTLVDSDNDVISQFRSWELVGNTIDAARALDVALAEGPFSFTLDRAQTLYFTFSDTNYGDNRGGVSLDLSLVPTAVPVPGTALLMGLGLLAMKRRQRNAS